MRVFIAYDIPENVRESVVDFMKKIPYVRGKFVEKENLHITLGFLKKNGVPDLNESDAKRVCKVINELDVESFEIGLKGVELIPSDRYIRVIAIGVGKGKERFVKIQEEIEKRLKEFGIKSEWHPPHLTLLRVKVILDKNAFLKWWEKVKEVSFGDVLFNEIKVKRSILTPKGPIYKDICIRRF